MLADPDFLRDAANAKLEVAPVSAETLASAVRAALDAPPEAKTRARKYFK
jgi:hypothetical protein